jgi:hypothetical protein
LARERSPVSANVFDKAHAVALTRLVGFNPLGVMHEYFAVIVRTHEPETLVPDPGFDGAGLPLDFHDAVQPSV